jgi:formylmethanofuran dehydrogenase subunit A
MTHEWITDRLPTAPAPARKVVQIAVGVELLLLCDDGTMWVMKTNGGPWIQLPAIPQPED